MYVCVRMCACVLVCLYTYILKMMQSAETLKLKMWCTDFFAYDLQVQINLGLTKDKSGNHSFVRSIAAGAFAGCMGAVVGSPLYMVTYF